MFKTFVIVDYLAGWISDNAGIEVGETLPPLSQASEGSQGQTTPAKHTKVDCADGGRH